MHEYQCVTSAHIMRAVKAGCIYVHCSGVCQTAQPESGDTGDDNSGCGVPTRSYRAGMGYGSPPGNPSGRGSGSAETSSPGGVFTRFAPPAGTSSCAGACGLFPHVLANSDALMRKRIFSHVAHCLSGQDSTCCTAILIMADGSSCRKTVLAASTLEPFAGGEADLCAPEANSSVPMGVPMRRSESLPPSSSPQLVSTLSALSRRNGRSGGAAKSRGQALATT
mmetsp:Transcript_65322/g.145780  ORF Transcript_65322/g.145780 Transcript_65322/m.145780 type:complete len:223 (-) Transcript_65322:148-816(-)